MTSEIRRVEEICASLVREYLSRKGLRTTLQVLDEEMPRTEFSISNRQLLAKELQIEKLMKANKEQEVSFRAMLEVLTKALLDKRVTISMSRPESTEPQDRLLRKELDLESLGVPAKDVGSITSSRHKTSKSSTKSRSGLDGTDMFLEDVVGSETLAGDGKAGIFSPAVEENSLTSKPRPARPFSSKPRGQQMILTANDMVERRRSVPSRLREVGKPAGVIPKPLEMGREGQSTRSKNVMDVLSTEKPNRESSFLNPKTRMSAPQNLFSSEPKESAEPWELSPSTRDARTTPRSTGRHYRINSVEDIFEPEKRGLQRTPSIESKESESYSVEASSMASDRPPTRTSSTRSTEQPGLSTMGDLEIGECDDLDMDVQNLNLMQPMTRAPRISSLESTPITTQLATELRMLIFGTGMRSFNDEWKMQNLGFCDLPGLEYGIVQRKGGPCGVLAAIQACVLQEELFGPQKLPHKRCTEPTRSERSEFLALALSRIFWRAGANQATVVMPSNKTHVYGSARYKQDGLTETLVLYKFGKLEELQNFMKQMVCQYEVDGNSGAILALYSAILSRGIDNLKKDMDDPGMTLMGAHGYCTQEMVNLILTGRASSNVFNNIVELDSENGQSMILRGIFSRSDIGFLSLFEHYKSCQVGTFYKTPKFPIWVVCCESHFSVLFSTKADLVNDWKAERRFDLIYYDGLARQQEEIRLTIDTTTSWMPRQEPNEDLVPPLEHCIRTKWADSMVNWNGTEPLL